MTRTPSAIDRLAEHYYDANLALSPIELTYLGSHDRQDEYDDFSPAGIDQRASLVNSTLAELDGLRPADQVDQVTVDALRERLGVDADLHRQGLDLMDISGIASGLHSIREVIDIMPTDSPADWQVIGRRLQNSGPAVEGWLESQLLGIENGVRPAIRQVNLLIEQVRSWCADGSDGSSIGFFADLAVRAHQAFPDLPAAVSQTLDEGIAAARQAFLLVADRLDSRIKPLAVEQDGVGIDRYRYFLRTFTGADFDLEQTYAWGLEEVARLEAEQERVAAILRPGLSVPATKDSLDQDPRYQLQGTDALQAWMQGKADAALAALNGTHFDIPEPACRIECCIAPTHDGGIYYTQPTADFSRPGRMWWSVPEGEDSFGTWRELSTVYHEGTPGHHLQMSIAIANQELNRWRQNGVWTSGHGEGWALYAETLMSELGFLEDPADYLGYLDSSMLRAVRVVIDLGLHCGFEVPVDLGLGGGDWTWDKAWAYFNSHVSMSRGQARYELNRYFGWSGQAPAYKLGERTWLDLREQAKQRAAAAGQDFSLKDFHMKALRLGGLGLSTLKKFVA